MVPKVADSSCASSGGRRRCPASDHEWQPKQDQCSIEQQRSELASGSPEFLHKRCSSTASFLAVAITARFFPLKTGASFKAEAPVALFQTQRRQPVSSFAVFSYDVSGDGQRFLVITKLSEANAPLSILLNWASEMEE
jgi:hypothetical protein